MADDWLPDIAELSSTGSDFMSDAEYSQFFENIEPTYSDSFVGNLGDPVGTASSLVNLLKTGLSTGADILGGGDAKGGAGFATKPNPARQAALEAQMSQVYGRTASQITSPRGTGARNPHSDAIMRGFNPNAMTSFGRIITASRAGESATRVYGRARETIA